VTYGEQTENREEDYGQPPAKHFSLIGAQHSHLLTDTPTTLYHVSSPKVARILAFRLLWVLFLGGSQPVELRMSSTRLARLFQPELAD